MKKHLLPFFFLIFGFSIAQKSGNLSLIWSENQKVSYGEYFYTIPNFDVNNFNFNEAKKTILFVSKFLVDAEIDESNLQISNVVYEPIAENLLGELDKSKISNFLNAKISNSIAREEIRAVLTFNPIIKDDNGYKKVISLSYNFDVATASNRIASTSAQPAAIINSVLSSGTFKRFYVQKSGVYKITKSFLDQIGFSTSGVNPQKIKIYGNGGRMVPLSNAIPYPLDLTENSIQVIGDADGVFNDSDYILFYAEGVDNWSSENKTHLNLYEDKSYYYVTTDGANGKRISTQNPITQPSTLNLSTYDDYYFHEVDLTNIGKLGRVWFGEPFNINNEQTFDFSIPNINTSFPTQCSIHYGSSAFAVTTFKTVVNGVDLGNVNMNQVVLNSGVEAAENFVNTNLASTANFSVKITYNNNGLPTAKAYLDYIILKSKSNLTGFGKQYRFRYSNSVSQNGVVQIGRAHV